MFGEEFCGETYEASQELHRLGMSRQRIWWGIQVAIDMSQQIETEKPFLCAQAPDLHRRMKLNSNAPGP